MPGTTTQLTYATALGSGALVSSANTIVLGRAVEDVTVIGATGDDGSLNKLQVAGGIKATSGMISATRTSQIGSGLPLLSLMNGAVGGGTYCDIHLANYSNWTNTPPATIRFIDENHSNHITFRTKIIGGLDTSDQERLRITTSGRVLIGTTTDDESNLLQVSGGIKAVDGLSVGGTGTTSYQGAYLQWNRNIGTGSTYIINQKGLGGGGIRFGESDTSNNFTQNMMLSAAGNLTVGGTGTFGGAVTAASFSGSGASLTGLNGDNISSGTVAVARGGTGVNTAPGSGQLLIGNGTGYTLANLTGTSNQVNVTNGAGSITLSLPQSIATSSTPTFGGMTLNGGLIGTTGTFSGQVAVVQSASVPGLRITGAGLGGGTTDNSNGLFIGLGYNETNNRQLWIGPTESIGSAVSGVFRYTAGAYIATVNAVTGDNATRLPVNLGTDTSDVAVGALGTTAYNATLPGKLSVYAEAAKKGLVVRAAASQTGNLFEAQNNSGTALFTINPSGNTTVGGNLAVASYGTFSGVDANSRAIRAFYNGNVGIAVGRTGEEVVLGVSNGGGGWATNAAAGDAVLRTASTGARIILTNDTTNSTLTVYNGRVGIGNINPGTTLDVTGAGSFSSNLTVGGTLGVTGATTLTGALAANGGLTATTGTFSNTINLAAGTTTVAPLKFQSGTNLTIPVFGAVEFDGTNLYLTNNSGTPTRKTVAYTDSNITGNAATLTTAADNTTNATRYLTFANAVSGSQSLSTDTGLTYNPSTDRLTAGVFSGSVAATSGTFSSTLDVTGNITLPTSGTTAPSSQLYFGAAAQSSDTIALGRFNTSNDNAVLQLTLGDNPGSAPGGSGDEFRIVTSANENGTGAYNTRHYFRSNGDAYHAGTLAVTGATTLTGALAANGGLTTIGKISFDNTNGDKLQLWSNFGFGINSNNLNAFIPNGSYFSLRNGGSSTGANVFQVDGSGNTTVSGTLGVTGATTLTGALAANGGLSSTTGSFSSSVTATNFIGNINGLTSGQIAQSNFYNIIGPQQLDMNATVAASGVFRYDNGGPAMLNAPNDSSSISGVSQGDASRGMQIAIPFDSDNLYFRRGGSGWGAWQQTVTFNNIASAVSFGTNMRLGTNSLPPTSSTGTFNTAVGVSALGAKTDNTGSLNSAFGSYALANNTAGTNNSAFGLSAMNVNLEGSRNVAFGADALRQNMLGNNNSAVGYNTLRNNTGSNNTGLGHNAGNSNTSGSDNTFLGHSANSTSNALTYATALGSGSSVATSSTIVLGRTSDVTVIGDTGAATSGSSLYQGKLQVTGDIRTTGNVYAAGVQLTSDVRLKQNITQLNPQDTLTRLKSLGAYSYELTQDPTRQRRIGVLAQEVVNLFPEVALMNASGYYSVDYSALGAIAAASVGQLATKFDQFAGHFDFSPDGASLALKVQRLQVAAVETDALTSKKITAGQLSAQTLDGETLSFKAGAIDALTAQKLTVKSRLATDTLDAQSIFTKKLKAETLAAGRADLDSLSATDLSAQTATVSHLYQLSDIRLKENIIQYSPAAVLERLGALNIYNYSLKADTLKRRTTGVLAQEVVRLLPELTQIDEKGLYAVDYQALGAMAAASVGALNQKFEATGLQVKDAGGTLYVNLPKFEVSNLSAERIEAKRIKTAYLEAEEAKIKELEVQNLKANNTKSKNIEAGTVNSGQIDAFAALGAPVNAFTAANDAHYLVNTSAEDGSYSTATVFVSNGTARVVPISNQGIDVVAQGMQVQVVAPSKKVRVSWIRMS
ncbi:MAG: tail fiber domain-containing protein [Burkholderiaceae bacterium]